MSHLIKRIKENIWDNKLIYGLTTVGALTFTYLIIKSPEMQKKCFLEQTEIYMQARSAVEKIEGQIISDADISRLVCETLGKKNCEKPAVPTCTELAQLIEKYTPKIIY
jgi:hypothetical protein